MNVTKNIFELADGLGISLLFFKFPLHFVEIAYHFFIFTQQNQFFKTNQLQLRRKSSNETWQSTNVNKIHISWSESPLKMHLKIKGKKKERKDLYRILDFSQQVQLPDY